MLPVPVFSAPVLALIARVFGELPRLDLAGQWLVVELCETRLADPRDFITAKNVTQITGYKSTKVGQLIRDKVIASEKDGAKIQSPRRISRNSLLSFQISGVVRSHRIAAAE
jgi:hypothetical protein